MHLNYHQEREIAFLVPNTHVEVVLQELVSAPSIVYRTRVLTLKRATRKVEIDFYFKTDSENARQRFKIKVKDHKLIGLWSNKRIVADRQFEGKSEVMTGESLWQELWTTGPVIAALHKNTTEFKYVANRCMAIFALQECWTFDPAHPADGLLFSHLEIEGDATIDLHGFYEESSIGVRLQPYLKPLPLEQGNKLHVAMRHMHHPFFLHFDDQQSMHQSFRKLLEQISLHKYTAAKASHREETS